MPTVAALTLSCAEPLVAQQAQPFTLEQVRSYPFPTELTAAATGSRIAWAFNEAGARNLWAAEGPDFRARKLTSYDVDDGQELSSVSISSDGKWIVYIRGGDFGSNWDDGEPVNPTHAPGPPNVAIWVVPFAGGEPKRLGSGTSPAISPAGGRVAFVDGGQVWSVPIDGSSPARKLFTARGSNGQPQWSPDGRRLAFVSSRGDHSFVGVYSDSVTPILYIDPSTSRDGTPRWSPDGRQLVFVRRPGSGGAPDSILATRPNPWTLRVADASTGRSSEIYRSPETMRGSVPSTHGGYNLHWAAGDRIVFMSYADGWPHLYSLPAAGGRPLLLTPGDYMAEHIRLSPDGRHLVFAANAGSTADDIDRRHVVRAPVDRAEPEVLTPGTGIEWSPVVTGDGSSIVYIGATPKRPPLPTVMPFSGGASKRLAEDRVPSTFPTDRLVTPTKVTFRAPDGTLVHGQLFEPIGGAAEKPAIVYVHGGPPRQMLLGWHYSDYYANAYALNQYLASRGFVVLALNYRLGIGYGYDFHRPPNAGPSGASEYQDVRAAGEWLARRPEVDAKRIGIYGGSYGGYLTALALARDSELFAAGVDIHGVHDYSASRAQSWLSRSRFERAPDVDHALETAWRSSPVADVATWKSPVLLIHGDDDRNVAFSQTVDLARRLAAAGVPYEELVIVDDTHHFMRHANWLRVGQATADFLERMLGSGSAATDGSR